MAYVLADGIRVSKAKLGKLEQLGGAATRNLRLWSPHCRIAPACLSACPRYYLAHQESWIYVLRTTVLLQVCRSAAALRGYGGSNHLIFFFSSHLFLNVFWEVMTLCSSKVRAGKQ